MAEKGPPAPTPNLKKKFPVTGQITKKGNNLNPKVIVKTIDQNQGQNALNPPNQPVHLPDQPQDIPNSPLHHLTLQIHQIPQINQTNQISQINQTQWKCQTHRIHQIHLTHLIYKTVQINQTR